MQPGDHITFHGHKFDYTTPGRRYLIADVTPRTLYVRNEETGGGTFLNRAHMAAFKAQGRIDWTIEPATTN